MHGASWRTAAQLITIDEAMLLEEESYRALPFPIGKLHQ
jgi:hypothetical protein